jgi:hypothetical protein
MGTRKQAKICAEGCEGGRLSVSFFLSLNDLIYATSVSNFLVTKTVKKTVKINHEILEKP